jgi:integrase
VGESEGGKRLGGGQNPSPPARQKRLVGITPLSRKNKQVYQVAFSFKGVQCREVVDLPHSKANEQYCMRLRAEIMGKIERGEFRYGDYFQDSARAEVFGHAPVKSKLLRGLLEAYRDRVKSTLEASTFAGYRKAIDNNLIPWFGGKTLAELKPADIRDWVGLQAVSLKTIRNRLLPLRGVLDEAVADELIPFNPIDRVTLAKLVPVDKRTSDFEPEPYTAGELKTLLGNLSNLRERYAFQFWAYTGVRTGELVGLRWPRVDLEVKTVHIRETTTEGKDKARPKTKAGVRTIPLLPAALEALEGMRELTMLAGQRVFTNTRAAAKDDAWRDSTLARVWKAAHKDTGIAYRNPYQLRHTFASQLLSQGENPAYISKLLGHKTVEMVQRTYGRWVSEGEKLGFDRPPRQYGVLLLWNHADSHVKNM